ncbi:MAG: hypothetical protein ABL867_00395, partial [Rickettsiales bacterium]
MKKEIVYKENPWEDEPMVGRRIIADFLPSPEELRRAEGMNYISTRGTAPNLSFEDAVLAGLATDGGLYVPENVPTLSMAEITAMQPLSYTDRAY